MTDSSPITGDIHRTVSPQGGPKKRRRRLVTIVLSNLNRFFTGRFVGKFIVERILKTPPHLAYVATLARETLMSTKQALNDKLQGSVAL